MPVYGKCECFVMQMLYVCILCASCVSPQCCVLHDLQFVKLGEDARGDHIRTITFNNKIETTSKHIANCFTNNSQTLSNTQHTKQTDTLTEQHTTYKDTTSHSLLLRSKMLYNKIKITIHTVLTN